MNKSSEENSLVKEFFDHLQNGIITKWYPKCIDEKDGGYFSNLAYNFDVMPEQDKMIVSQARHIWATSKFSTFFGKEKFVSIAEHGFNFLKNKMWDKEFGGFYQMLSKDGGISDYHGFYDEKRTYGNAFALYALAALYELKKNPEALELAEKTFNWIEEKAGDKTLNGYYQFLTREGKVFDNNSDHKTKASDANEVGYKDQNSSIHLLEAYTEFYNANKSAELESRLKNILFLIRDVQVNKDGYLNLFFYPDWIPISFKNSDAETREKNFGLEHVSFGHNYETAFLMLEASYALGLENDLRTLEVAKKMLDHAIENGWDKNSAGFFDEGYYFAGDDKCKIIKDTKVWWAQAEGLNALLIFSKIFPDQKKYYKLFLKQWEYIKKYLIDPINGDWYWGSLEKEPFYIHEPKSTIWKCTYHTGRTLMNCIKIFDDGSLPISYKNEFKKEKEHFDTFINHWKNTAKNLK